MDGGSLSEFWELETKPKKKKKEREDNVTEKDGLNASSQIKKLRRTNRDNKYL